MSQQPPSAWNPGGWSPPPPPPQAPQTRLLGKGVTGVVAVDDHFVTIRRTRALAKANGFTRGEKRISIEGIAAVQYKAPGLANGYIQFTLAGGIESTKGVMGATKDENSVVFASKHRGEFETIRHYIEARIVDRHRQGSTRVEPVVLSPKDLPQQLRELAALRDEGLLTEEEFAVQKAKVLNS